MEELCPVCNKFEIYSETLTNGWCLNCHHQHEEDITEMENQFIE